MKGKIINESRLLMKFILQDGLNPTKCDFKSSLYGSLN